MTLVELEKRLAAATGPDREIDDMIRTIFGGFIPWTIGETDDVARYGDSLVQASGAPRPVNNQAYHLPRYTRSIDAAVLLVARALPGWRFTSIAYEPDADAARPWGAIVSEQKVDDLSRIVPAIAPTPALALCLAIVRALSHPTTTAGGGR